MTFNGRVRTGVLAGVTITVLAGLIVAGVGGAFVMYGKIEALQTSNALIHGELTEFRKEVNDRLLYLERER